MTMLFAAAALFIAIHLLIAGTRVRDAITGVVGENAYLGLFSLASIGSIAWLAISYNRAQAGADDPTFYVPAIGLRHLAIPIVLLSFLIGVPGLLANSPTRVRGEGVATKEGTDYGIVRVTRHPFLWAVVIWSAFHMSVNGDEASMVLFGTFFVVAFLGTFSIDAKRKRKLGADWSIFTKKTSNIPFVAILTGRNKFSAREYFDWRFIVAIALFVVVLFFHARIFGVSPFPTGWVPI